MNGKMSVLRLGLSYAGMFLGAGFVSGRELWQFFGSAGRAGLYGLLLSAVLFFLSGAAFFHLAEEMPGRRVGEILVPGRHPFLSGLVESAEALLLYGVVVIMTAGAGAMVRQVTGIPAAAAGFVFAVLLFAASLKDIRSAVAVFSVLAPWFRNLYSVLMLAGMFSAALGCLVGFLGQLGSTVEAGKTGNAGQSGNAGQTAKTGQINEAGERKREEKSSQTSVLPRNSAIACFSAFILSLAGFGNLIGFIYPLFGYIGLPCLLCVLWQRARRKWSKTAADPAAEEKKSTVSDGLHRIG